MTFADDELRRRVRELGRAEAAAAPPLGDLLRASAALRAPGRSAVRPRPLVGLLGAAAAVLVAVAWWWPGTRSRERPVAPSRAETSTEPTAEWNLPTDGLLLEPRAAAAGDVDRLSREIDGLLRP